ncbi:MAG: DUF3943 domain-containing protein [Anaeromyxobacteraceae bacterium]
MRNANRGVVALAILAVVAPRAARGVEPEVQPAAEAGTPPAEEAPALDWSTFTYTKPAPTHRLRLGLEELGAVSVAFIGYVIQDPPSSVPGVRMPVYPWEKLTFQAGSWVFDADNYGTNMVGHPTAGTIYYLIARGSRVSIPEAFAWTFGASLLWEVIEYKEAASINDQIMTPAAGLAIGEALTQLSSWFDRSSDALASKAMAWLFNPVKKFHDWIDKVVPDRDPRTRGWHEFVVAAGVGLLHQSAAQATYPVVTLSAGTSLFRAPGYGEPGRATFAFADGNASRIGLGITFTGDAVVDLLFDTGTAFAGVLLRDVDGTPEDRHGAEFLVAGTVGYEYGLHRWNLADGEPNRIALVRLPGLDLRWRAFAGPWTFAAGLDVALTFGGVQPFALQGPVTFPAGSTFPPVVTANGYAYAIGGRFAPSLEIRRDEAVLGAALWFDALAGLTGPNVVEPPGQMVSLSDRRTLLSAWARWRVPDPSLEFSLTWQWRARSGTAGVVARSEQEYAFLGSLGVVF